MTPKRDAMTMTAATAMGDEVRGNGGHEDPRVSWRRRLRRPPVATTPVGAALWPAVPPRRRCRHPPTSSHAAVRHRRGGDVAAEDEATPRALLSAVAAAPTSLTRPAVPATQRLTTAKPSTKTVLTPASCYPVDSPLSERKRRPRRRRAADTAAAAATTAAALDDNETLMPRRKRRATVTQPLHLEVPALALVSADGDDDDTGAGPHRRPPPHAPDDALLFKVTGSPAISPRSIRNSLAETDFDMDGNIRSRKGSIAINIPPGETSTSSSSSTSATTLGARDETPQDAEDDVVMTPTAGAPTGPTAAAASPKARANSTESPAPDSIATTDPAADSALAQLSGAQLWVHRVLATHHQTLHTLGLERRDFPNTRLSLKQLETLLGPVIALCNMMTPLQYGIRTPTPSIARTMKEVHYWKLWESDTIDIGIFFMPPNSVIPLHNHPGMSVVTRILYGSAQVTSYDLVAKSELNHLSADDVEAGNENVKWARVSREGEFVGESTMWLDPRRFNLHHIQANPTVGCALLDIMIPPYNNTDRDCHHFKIVAERILAQAEQRVVKMLESITPDNHNDPSGSSAASTAMAQT